MKPLHPYPVPYTPSSEQGEFYLQRKFARIRRQLKEEAVEAEKAAAQEKARKVTPLKREGR